MKELIIFNKKLFKFQNLHFYSFQMTVMQDPKCTPTDIHPYVMYLREYNIDTERRFSTIDLVPPQ